MDDTFSKIKGVFNEVIGSIPEKPEAELKDLYMDSLDLLELISTLENDFEIQIEDSAAESFKTVGDIVSYIDSKKKA